MKKHVTVSNLTLNLWLDFVCPALRAVNMLEEVPAKDEWHEFTAEVIEAETAEEIAHCMTVACFNAHGNNEYTSLEEAKQMLYQIEVSIKYRTATREALATLREALAARIAETLTEPTGEPVAESAETFPCLRAALESEYAACAVHAEYFVEHGYYMHWAEENHIESDDGLRQWSTPAKWEAYQRGTLSREKAVQLAAARALRDVEKTHRRELEKLDRAALAPELDFVTLTVTWTSSATWGHNPRVEAVTNEAKVFTGTASGYGYNKLSAAIANALNDSPAVLRALYTAAEKALASGQRFNRLNASTVTWRDVLGYGSGYSVVPYFECGCDVSCFETLFRNCGYSFRCTVDTKHISAYTVTRKGAA